DTSDFPMVPMRPRGLEPPRGKPPTRPSTLRVYQFRHGREGRESIGAAASGRTGASDPSDAALSCPNTCSSRHPAPSTARDDGRPHEAPAGDLRVHQAVLVAPRLSADGA